MRIIDHEMHACADLPIRERAHFAQIKLELE
jgi:hypothetical protein